MPKRLLARWQPECIREFQAAALWRFDEGVALAAAGYRTGAIYLWGYSAEMALKAAYFRLLGHNETDLITWSGHLFPAIVSGRQYGIAWPNQGQGHNVRAWAELLVTKHAATPGAAYATAFGLEVQERGQRLANCGVKHSDITRIWPICMK
jgi:hypothetical protein